MRHIRQGYASPYARGCHASARANSPNGLRGEKVLVYTSLYFYSRFAVLPGSGAMINGRRGIPGGAVAGVASGMRGNLRRAILRFDAKKMANYFVLRWPSRPIIAPSIGANLWHCFRWPAHFYLFSLYDGAILIIYLFLSPASTRPTPFTLGTITPYLGLKR